MESGALLINKPAGLTSSDVVTRLKWAMVNGGYAPKGFRIGHGGTLDPFATGVLVVLFNEATKLADTYLHSQKAYDGIIQLGTETATGDFTGEAVRQCAVEKISLDAWKTSAQEFVNQAYLQTPPMYSAKKRDGIPFHQLARAGKTLEREAILKKIHAFEIALPPADPAQPSTQNCLQFTVQCESGTYVRVLAEDLAKSQNQAAHLLSLRRIRSSDVNFDACENLEEVLAQLQERKPVSEMRFFRELSEVALHVPRFPVSPETAGRLRHGIKAEVESCLQQMNERGLDAKYALASCANELVALFERNAPLTWRLQRIFNSKLQSE